MLVSTLSAIAKIYLLFVLEVQASNTGIIGICADIFDNSSPEVVKSIMVDLQASTQKEGIPDAAVHLRLNDHAQLRYYTSQGIPEIGQAAGGRHLYLEVLRNIPGTFTTKDIVHLERMHGNLLRVLRRPDGTYHVSRWEAKSTIDLDIHTGYVRTDSDVARDLLRNLVESRKHEESNAMLFLDLDRLTLVNYLPGGMQRGDRYIRESLRVISSNLRLSDAAKPQGTLRQDTKDIGFRLQNGDEYFFLLQGVNKQSLDVIKQRINEALKRDPGILAITREAFELYQVFLKNLRRLPSYQALQRASTPEVKLEKFLRESKMWQSLGAERQQLIEQNPYEFVRFIQEYVVSLEAIRRGERILAMQLGASIGSIMMRPHHTYETLHVEAEAAMRQEKLSRLSALELVLPSDLIYYQKPDISFPEFYLP